MHPEVCEFISRTIYQGRLSNHSSTVNRTIKYDPATASRIQSEAGIVFVPVHHSGNTQFSDEEVEVIAGITQELLGRTHHDRDGRMIGPVGIQDILYVAPYNMQVKRLREQLPDGARVGSVDKFQGQEAPIVVVSAFGPASVSLFLLSSDSFGSNSSSAAKGLGSFSSSNASSLALDWLSFSFDSSSAAFKGAL